MTMSKTIVKVPCRVCDKVYELEVEENDLKEYVQPPHERRLIQEIFPYLTPQERELLISHTCNKCWKEMFDFTPKWGDEE